MVELTLQPPLTKYFSDELRQVVSQPFSGSRTLVSGQVSDASVYGMDESDGYVRAVISD